MNPSPLISIEAIALIATAVTTILGGFFVSFWSYQNRKLTIKQEEDRIKREEAKEEREAKRRMDEVLQKAKEKRDQDEVTFKLALLAKSTAEGINRHVTEKTNQAINVVKESKEERRQQMEEVKQINEKQIEVGNRVNDKLIGLGMLVKERTGIDTDHITKVEIVSMPEILQIEEIK